MFTTLVYVTFVAEPEGLGAWERCALIEVPVRGRKVKREDIVQAMLGQGWWLDKDDIVSARLADPSKTAGQHSMP